MDIADVGHIAQNFHIVANALGLGSCSVDAWANEIMTNIWILMVREVFNIAGYCMKNQRW